MRFCTSHRSASCRPHPCQIWLLLLTACGICGPPCLAQKDVPPALVSIAGHLPRAVLTAQPLGAVDAALPISLALSLPLRNRAEREDLMRRLYDPQDPLYGKYLTEAQFAARFGPTQADCDAVTAYVKSQGLTVTKTFPNRALLDVSGTAAAVEQAFHVHLRQYRAADGRVFRAPDADPSLPAPLAARVLGIAGLDDAVLYRPAMARLAPPDRPALGNGPNGGLSPADIIQAYDLSTYAQKASNQVLALVELDGYNFSDIQAYAQQFPFPSTNVTNVFLDNASQSVPDPSDENQEEVTLDIELMLALAGGSSIYVYEAPNSSVGRVDVYATIADTPDSSKGLNYPLATAVSTSWGGAENYTGSAERASDAQSFAEMQARGQSMFAASGDSGAYADAKDAALNGQQATVSVGDPASQPLVCGVGGTTLSLNGDGSYAGEATWQGTLAGITSNAGGSGGGISDLAPIPDYQAGAISGASGGSTTRRNVPDVSLDADGLVSGYAIYSSAYFHDTTQPIGWNPGGGGTSAAAPLWAAFTALVNQQRGLAGEAPLGFPNPALYAIGEGPNYSRDFHDVTTNNNLFYSAVPGYDLTTGWGSFNGANLLADLVASGGGSPVVPTALAFNPNPVVVGHNSSGTVTLSGPAPPGGAVVTVAYGGSPFTGFTIPTGATSGPFGVGIPSTSTQADYTFTASCNGTSVSATLKAIPAVTLSSLVFNPDPVTGGNPSTGTVTLTAPAPAGGITVPVTAPGWSSVSLSIAAGRLSGGFNAETTAVSAQTNSLFTASYAGASVSATLTVNPATTVVPTTLTFGPNPVVGGQTTYGTITLSGPAPSGGALITVTQNGNAVETFTIQAGVAGGAFYINTAPVTVQTDYPYAASYAGVSVNATLTVLPALPASTTHLLWDNTDGRMMFWNLDAQGSLLSLQGYGPYTDDGKGLWHAKALATAPDGTSRIVWNNGDSRVMLWSLDEQGALLDITGYGPYTDDGKGLWHAAAVSVGPDNQTRLLWNDDDRRVMLWSLDGSGGVTGIAGYGPYTDASQPDAAQNLWRAVSVSTGPDGLTHVLWDNTDHRIMLWDVRPDFGVAGIAGYGPYTDDSQPNPAGNLWDGVGVSVGPDGLPHVLWGNTDRRAMLWGLGGSGGVAGYGPYDDDGKGLWGVTGLAAGPDGVTRLLWNDDDRRVMLWSLDGSGGVTGIAGYGPYTDASQPDAAQNLWSAVGVSAGP